MDRIESYRLQVPKEGIYDVQPPDEVHQFCALPHPPPRSTPPALLRGFGGLVIMAIVILTLYLRG